MDKFSGWLLDRIKNQDINQSELARRSGLSRQVISDIINNRRTRPDPETISAIAYGLDIPTETAYRAAGLLPDLPSPRQAAAEILGYKLNELSDKQIDELLKYIEFMQERDEPQPKTNRESVNHSPETLK